jgi:hypothetical protein
MKDKTMVRLVKGDMVKDLTNEEVIARCEADGWVVEGKEYLTSGVSERDALKAEADALGLEYPANIKTEKLIKLIQEAKDE